MASFNWNEMIYNLAEAHEDGWHDLRSDEIFEELVIGPARWPAHLAIDMPDVAKPGVRSRPSSLAKRLLPV
jgi:hypothetical protein